MEKYVSEKNEKFADKVMVLGAISGRGTLPLIRVPQNVKIIATYDVDKLLKSLFEEEILKRYPGETHKVFIHHDAASSHTARIRAQYAAELKHKFGIAIISNKEIHAKSPDASPMDFFGFGMLKQALLRDKLPLLIDFAKFRMTNGRR